MAGTWGTEWHSEWSSSEFQTQEGPSGERQPAGGARALTSAPAAQPHTNTNADGPSIAAAQPSTRPPRGCPQSRSPAWPAHACEVGHMRCYTVPPGHRAHSWTSKHIRTRHRPRAMVSRMMSKGSEVEPLAPSCLAQTPAPALGAATSLLAPKLLAPGPHGQPDPSSWQRQALPKPRRRFTDPVWLELVSSPVGTMPSLHPACLEPRLGP